MHYTQWAIPYTLGSTLKNCPKPLTPSKEQDLIGYLRYSFNAYVIREMKYDYIDNLKKDLNSKESKEIYRAIKRTEDFDQGYDKNGVYILSNKTAINLNNYPNFLNNHQDIKDEFYNLMRLEETTKDIYNFIDQKIESFSSNRYSDKTLECIDELTSLFRIPSNIKIVAAMALVTGSYMLSAPLILITGFAIPYALYDTLTGEQQLIIAQQKKSFKCNLYIEEDSLSHQTLMECNGVTTEYCDV